MSKVIKKIERQVNGLTKTTEYRVGCEGCKHLITGPNHYNSGTEYRCRVTFYAWFDPFSGTFERYNGQLISIANKNGRCKKREEFKQ